jgi:S-DNA-T family DNA segregation ATPase FtsK/SpoIIIE
MKIMLMDTSKLVNLILPSEVFGNYWIVNSEKQNLVSVEAQDGEWVLKSNSDVKVFRNGNALTDVRLEYEKFYTLKNVLENKSYVIYISPVYDTNAIQLNISLSDVSSWYIGNNTAGDYTTAFNNIISYEQNGFARNQLKLNYNNGVYTIYNLNPQIPMYVNGIVTDSEELHYGDTIFILGFKLSMVGDIFYMNNPNKLVKYDAKSFINRSLPKLDYTKISPDPDAVIEMYKKEDYFLKPPRFDEKLEEKNLQVDPPPGGQKQEDMPAILTMGSMLMMGMSSMITGVVTFANIINGNTTLAESWTQLLTAAAMLSCMLILPSVTRLYNKHRKKVYERKRQETYSA